SAHIQSGGCVREADCAGQRLRAAADHELERAVVEPVCLGDGAAGGFAGFADAAGDIAASGGAERVESVGCGANACGAFDDEQRAGAGGTVDAGGGGDQPERRRAGDGAGGGGGAGELAAADGDARAGRGGADRGGGGGPFCGERGGDSGERAGEGDQRCAGG